MADRLNPWTLTAEQVASVRDPIVAAQVAGLAVLVPALRVGYANGLTSIPGMMAAIRKALTDPDIRRQWGALASASQSDGAAVWGAELDRVGIEADPEPDPGIAEAWERENIERIIDLRESVEAETEARIREAMDENMAAETLARDLEDVGLPATNGRLGGRAEVIAEDQAGNLEAATARDQQRKAGVTSYEWVTVGDTRVRPEHAGRNGQLFPWDDAPSDGHPGEPLACRCSAVGLFG